MDQKHGMRLRKIVSIIAGLCFLAILFAGSSLRRQWYQSTVIKQEREWVWLNARQLAEAGQPSAELQNGAIPGRWIQRDYLLFSNGWAGYRIHTTHAEDGLGNMALLRTDDGALYLSKLHYCVGIGEWMVPTISELPQPASAGEFLSGLGKYQEWNRLSSDGRVACVIRKLDMERTQNSYRIWIWIGRMDGSSQAALLDEQYVIPRSYLAWSTHWVSNERVEVDFYNYNGKSLQSVLDPDEDLSSNHLSTFTFHLDHNTLKFTDKD